MTKILCILFFIWALRCWCHCWCHCWCPCVLFM